jgi:sugar phosphate isomerase/epimerase
LTRRLFVAVSVSSGVVSFAKESSIQVGCQANAWPLEPGDFNRLLDVVGRIKALGYSGFECHIRFVRDQFNNAAEARKRIQATGVQFIGAHTSMQEAAHEDFAVYASGAAGLGAAYIVMSSSALAANGQFSLESLKAKAAQLEDLARTCRQSRIQLAYHNHTGEFANHNAEIAALADHTDPELVNFLIDAGHGYQGGGDPAEFMLRDSKRIVGCHIKTFREKIRQVPLGQGDFGFEALAAAIKKTGWVGWLIDEEGGGSAGGNASAVGPDREYIRQIFSV